MAKNVVVPSKVSLDTYYQRHWIDERVKQKEINPNAPEPHLYTHWFNTWGNDNAGKTHTTASLTASFAQTSHTVKQKPETNLLLKIIGFLSRDSYFVNVARSTLNSTIGILPYPFELPHTELADANTVRIVDEITFDEKLNGVEQSPEFDQKQESGQNKVVTPNDLLAELVNISHEGYDDAPLLVSDDVPVDEQSLVDVSGVEIKSYQELSGMTIGGLKKLAKELGLTVSKSDTKDTIIEMLINYYDDVFEGKRS